MQPAQLTKNSTSGGVQQNISLAFKLARPLLILFVCIIHMPSIEGFSSDHDQFDQPLTLAAVFFKDVVARGAVPILSVIAGYLAYSSYVRRKSFGYFVKTKASRLLLPFIVWSCISLIIGLIVNKLTGHNPGGVTDAFNIFGFFDGMLGLTRVPFNPPIYYLRDLFFLMVAVPLIHHFCRSKWIMLGLLLAYLSYFLVFTQDLPGFIVPYGEAGKFFVITYRWDSAIFFTLGYFFAYRALSLPETNFLIDFPVAMYLIILSAVLTMLLSIYNPTGFPFTPWRAGFGVIFVLALPTIFNTLLRTKDTWFGRLLNFLSPYSFILFLSHTPTSTIYYWAVKSGIGLNITERSPLVQQFLYGICYLVFCTLMAIAIRHTWKAIKPNKTRTNAAPAR